jgi:hypothetical protein
MSEENKTPRPRSGSRIQIAIKAALTGSHISMPFGSPRDGGGEVVVVRNPLLDLQQKQVVRNSAYLMNLMLSIIDLSRRSPGKKKRQNNTVLQGKLKACSERSVRLPLNL